MHTSTCTYAYIHMYICIHPHVHMFTPICTYVFIYLYLSTYTCAYSSKQLEREKPVESIPQTTARQCTCAPNSSQCVAREDSTTRSSRLHCTLPCILVCRRVRNRAWAAPFESRSSVAKHLTTQHNTPVVRVGPGTHWTHTRHQQVAPL